MRAVMYFEDFCCFLAWLRVCLKISVVLFLGLKSVVFFAVGLRGDV